MVVVAWSCQHGSLHVVVMMYSLVGVDDVLEVDGSTVYLLLENRKYSIPVLVGTPLAIR